MTPLIDIMLVLLIIFIITSPRVHISVDRFAKYKVVAQTAADMQQRGLRMIGFISDEYF